MAANEICWIGMDVKMSLHEFIFQNAKFITDKDLDFRWVPTGKLVCRIVNRIK